MNINGNSKVKLACLTVVIASSLITSSARAVTPDNGFALSGIWTQAKLLKEYIDWRAALGWGTIGTTNVLIAKITGASGGAMTKQVFTDICGTSAAGLMANWKPASEPTAASHIKSVVKSASVVGAASACGWVSQFAFNKINGEIPKAQSFINNTATQTEKNAISNTASETNSQLLAMEAALRSLSNAYNDHASNQRDFDANCKGSNSGSQFCNDVRTNLKNSTKNYDDALASFNRHGSQLSNDMASLNREIRS
jgi:hypothetical protein